MNKQNELIFEREVVFCEHPPFPRNMMIELTNACNHNCVFCGYKDMLRHKKMADKEFTKEIIHEAYEQGTREIGFYLIGEPFLNPDIAEYVAFCKAEGFEYIYITTNGGEATPDKLTEVINAGLDSIKFSVNGATIDSYKKVHGKNDYQRVKENIMWLRNYIDKHNLPLKTFISFVKCNFNSGDEVIIHKEFDNYVDKIYTFDCSNQGGGMFNLVKDGIVDSLLPGSKAPCSMVFNRLHITVEGYLDACCADVDGNLVVADLHKMSLLDAWNSKIMVDLRKQHLTGFTSNNMCNICINNINNKIVPLVKR